MGLSVVVRLLCVAIAVVAASAAAASANSVSRSPRAFAVTVRGAIEQSADYKQERPQGECPYVYTGHWNNKLEFRSEKPTKVVVTRRAGRLRFSPAELAALGGALTTRGSGVFEAPGCQTVVSDCLPRSEAFHDGTASLWAHNRRILELRHFRHAQLRQPCGSAELLGKKPGSTDFAAARIGPNLLTDSHRRAVVTGSYSTEEQLGPPSVDSGTLSTHVSWTMTFVRVGR